MKAAALWAPLRKPAEIVTLFGLLETALAGVGRVIAGKSLGASANGALPPSYMKGAESDALALPHDGKRRKHGKSAGKANSKAPTGRAARWPGRAVRLCVARIRGKTGTRCETRAMDRLGLVPPLRGSDSFLGVPHPYGCG